MDGSGRVPIEELLSSTASVDDMRDEPPSFFYPNLPQPPMSRGRRFQAYVEDADEPPAYEELPRNTLNEPHPNSDVITTLWDPALIQATMFPPGFQVNELNHNAQGTHGNVGDNPSEEPNTNTPRRPLSRASTISTEPFPDFDAIEARPPSLVYRCQEEAYEYALTRLAEELVNVRGTPTAAAGLTGPNFSTDQERLPNGPSMITIQGVTPCSELSHHDYFCHVHEKQKLRIREKIYCTLRYSEDIPVHFRRRFTALANMVIDMEFIFFRENHFPREPLRFVTQGSLEKVRDYGTEMLRYLSRLGTTLNQSKITALSSQCLVSQVAVRTGLTALGRFQKMAEIFLNKTHTFEQEFFELFSKFYDGFFFDDFHIMYNNYLVKKPESERVPPILVDVSYRLNSVYKILNRLVEDYKILKDTNIDIGEKYLQPALEELTRGPGIWEQCVRASNPAGFYQSGLQLTPIIHYTEPRPMRQLLSGHVEPQVQSAYPSFTEDRASPARIAVSSGTQLRSTQTSYTEGRHTPVRIVDSPVTQRRMAELSLNPGLPGPVKVVDSPDTQRRMAQLAYTQDHRAPVNIVDSPGTQRRVVQASYSESYHGIINPRNTRLLSMETAYTEDRRHPGHIINSPESHHHLARPSQEQSYLSRAHPYALQQSVTESVNTYFTDGRRSRSPIIGEIIDFYENRTPFTEGYRLHSQIIDLGTTQVHQTQPARPQIAETIHHPQPRRRHDFEFIQGHDTQHRVENHQVHRFPGPSHFAVQSPPPINVEQVRSSEARYIHSMVQMIRGERPHSPGPWGRARLMSHTPEYQTQGGPYIRTQHAQSFHYNPGDHVHCHRPHFHVAENGRSPLPSPF
ncbi:hypothetical protein BJY01DRAFT_246822 [Aspergillus pseudoustus]|uniref:Uncharacterized protein n=1 Tax=Aspergillus pseudoustus TaxID=1810923 RepID=A0ABR4K560_9EURO